MKPFKAIAAMSENRVIGHENRIPWHLPEDFKWFKKTTTGQIIVMGRKTFESIGKPLPNRETIILSRNNFSVPGVRVVPDLMVVDFSNETREIFICGGSQIYAEFLSRCSDLYLTRVKKVIAGDAYFPPFEQLFSLKEIIADTPEFTIEHWIRDQAAA